MQKENAKNILVLKNPYRCHVGDLKKSKVSGFAATVKKKSWDQQFNA